MGQRWHPTSRRIYRMIRLRCHKKKRKRCRKESTLLPVNGTYKYRRDTISVPQHINTPHSSYRVAPSISGVICAKAAIIFCRRSASFCGLCPYTIDFTYHHTIKPGEPWVGPITVAPVIVACVLSKLRSMRARCGGAPSYWKMMASSTPSYVKCRSTNSWNMFR
jgi:hypothetical protein